ncbi:hypothetical protein M2302_006606 [Micromonospora sp. A200]|uniref:DUF7919 family protein n=1 Tax=Micromonospora sp. A200 TaxID=2940568 RepID=UPI002474240E|nr:hypothetical protein [Micromonospora sp. A200]MDH6466398.1 hypothetical protein [Micromonospora sp. A200]
MTYFEDLSSYSYSEVDVIELEAGWLRFRPRYDRINVGWLDAPHAFEEGPTPGWLAGTLLEIIAGPGINTMRGSHPCSFCPQSPAGSTPIDSMPSVDHPTGTLWLGNAEVRVPSAPGVMFAAPSLIWHYITAHSYRPPLEFIEAVRQYDHGWAAEPSLWIPDDAERITFD